MTPSSYSTEDRDDSLFQKTFARRCNRPSNYHIDEELAQVALMIVRERYADFGPTLDALEVKCISFELPLRIENQDSTQGNHGHTRVILEGRFADHLKHAILLAIQESGFQRYPLGARIGEHLA
jgi:hypothetical protein